MIRWIRRAALACAAVALAASPSVAQRTGTQRAAEAAVRRVVTGFSAALQAGDTARAMSYLHPDLVVYESGAAENREHYRAHHLSADIAFLAQVRPANARDQLTVSGDMALYLREYRMRGTWRGKAVDSPGVETLVLVNTPRGWKIRHIHWSSGD
ncbi:MAG TPA: nuclear transport factor 2 family protein [Longimicrobium sp.]|nr:nuclear transport factor 2 family protein [Longimicrobium sp.]